MSTCYITLTSKLSSLHCSNSYSKNLFHSKCCRPCYCVCQFVKYEANLPRKILLRLRLKNCSRSWESYPIARRVAVIAPALVPANLLIWGQMFSSSRSCGKRENEKSCKQMWSGENKGEETLKADVQVLTVISIRKVKFLWLYDGKKNKTKWVVLGMLKMLNHLTLSIVILNHLILSIVILNHLTRVSQYWIIPHWVL